MPTATKVYVGNLPDNCNPDTLRGLFDPYGTINELTVIKNYAFVHFLNEKDANNAVQDLHKSKMLGQQITVQISNSQGKQNNRGDNRRDDRDSRRRDDRHNDRRDNRGAPRRGSQQFNNNPMLGIGGMNMNPLGGILGAAPPTEQNVLGNLGIFSAVNTLAAAAAAEQQNRLTQKNELQQIQKPADQQRPLNQPDPDVRVRREVVHTRDVPNANKLGLSDGYVIYERYYVDPNHPLLKGLPVPELPRMTDSYVNSSSRDAYRHLNSTVINDVKKDPYDDYHRDRSPINLPPSRRDEYDREPHRDTQRDSRPRDYGY